MSSALNRCPPTMYADCNIRRLKSSEYLDTRQICAVFQKYLWYYLNRGQLQNWLSDKIHLLTSCLEKVDCIIEETIPGNSVNIPRAPTKRRHRIVTVSVLTGTLQDGQDVCFTTAYLVHQCNPLVVATWYTPHNICLLRGHKAIK